MQNFNPRLPGGRRHRRIPMPTAADVFQSTRVGGDTPDASFAMIVGISIHASRVGGDQRQHDAGILHNYFNPRLPGGRRHKYGGFALHQMYFNPRLPGGRRLAIFSIVSACGTFQSTPPGWEATAARDGFGLIFDNFNPCLPGGRRRDYDIVNIPIKHFNPRLPGGRRLQRLVAVKDIHRISIHASRVGGDHWR